MVGAGGAVLAHGAAELGHGGEQDLVLMRPKVGPEGADRPRQVPRLARKGHGLLDVGVPAAGLGEGDLQTDVGLDEQRDLAQQQNRDIAGATLKLRQIALGDTGILRQDLAAHAAPGAGIAHAFAHHLQEGGVFGRGFVPGFAHGMHYSAIWTGAPANDAL